MKKTNHILPTWLAIVLITVLSAGCSPQAKKASHLKDADQFFRSGQYDRAEIEYLNVLQIDGRNPEAIGRLALIYFDQGRLGRVMPFLVKGRELQPDNLDLRLKAGLFALASGKAAEARDAADYVLSRRPTDPEAPILLAVATVQPDQFEATKQKLHSLPAPAASSTPVLVALGTLELRQQHPQEAEANFRRAAELDPKSSIAQAAMGDWYKANNDLPKAEQAFKLAAELATPRSPQQLLYARFKIQTGDLAAARGELERVTKQTTDYLPVWILLAEVAAAEKKYPESGKLIAKVLSLDPAHPEALLMSGRLKLALGENEQAVAEMEKMLKVYPRSPQANFQAGLAYNASGNLTKAAASLNQALTLAPGYVDAALLLGEINLRNGDYRLASTQLTSLVQQHPEVVKARFLLADALRAQGNLNEAIAVFGQLEKQLPRSPQPLHGKALILLQQNKRDEARQAWDQALSLTPDFLPAVEQLVGLDFAEKNYSAALQRADQLIARNPKQAGAHVLRAKVLVAQKELNQAETSLRQAIELQPDSTGAYLLLARLYASSQRLDLALASFQTVAEKNPRSVEAFMMIGTIQLQRKNPTAAKEAFEKLLLVNPKFSPALNNLAYLYSDQFNQLDKAREMAQKARELLPNEPHTADTLGWILYKQGQYPWALSLLQESVAKLPESADVQYHLGMVAYMTGDEILAQTALRRAVQLDPALPGSVEANARLSVLAIDVKTATPEQLKVLEQLATKTPADPIVSGRLAAVYSRDGAPEKAIAAYRAALQANPKNVTATIELSRLYAAQRETAKALELAKAARKLAPDDPEVAHTLGRLAYEMGEYSWATSLLREAAQKQGESPELQFDLAEASYSVGQIAAAEDSLRAGLKGGGVSLRASWARQFLDMISMQTSPAETKLDPRQPEEILRTSPDFVPAMVALATARERVSDVSAARGIYEKVLKRYPDFYPAKIRLVVMSANQGEFDQRVYDLGLQAQAANPGNPDLIKAIGILAYLKGDLPKAVSILKESSKARTEDAEVWYYLGIAQLQVKDVKGGRISLDQALRIGLNPKFSAAAQKALSEMK